MLTGPLWNELGMDLTPTSAGVDVPFGSAEVVVVPIRGDSSLTWLMVTVEVPATSDPAPSPTVSLAT